MLDKSKVFAQRIAENIARYTPQERKLILARYGEGSYQIQRELKDVLIREKKWLST